MVGRRAVADKTCSACCNTTSCNKQLCTKETDLCYDDPTVNCKTTDDLFNICSNIQKAKLVCRRHCGLCNLTDGEWSSWTSWSACSVSCDDGVQLRSRTCTNPSPANGGLTCSGPANESKLCHVDLPCPVHGGWSAWLSWGSCDASCGVGLRSRMRTCTNPVPAHKGAYCHGDAHDYSVCTNDTCAVDGGWSTWSEWGKCSGNCGPGLKVKTRTCTNPAPVGHATGCIGDAHEYGICFDDCATTTTPTAPTTYAAGDCYDKLDNCYMYPKDSTCTHPAYRSWAMDKCRAYCGFCVRVTLTPVPCMDALPNCHEYDAGDLCSTPSYRHWVESNCYKYCKLPSCNGQASSLTTVTTIPAGTSTSGTTPS